MVHASLPPVHFDDMVNRNPLLGLYELAFVEGASGSGEFTYEFVCRDPNNEHDGCEGVAFGRRREEAEDRQFVEPYVKQSQQGSLSLCSILGEHS